MKLPRDVPGNDLAQALKLLGYDVTRQTGSHMRLTTSEGGEHHYNYSATQSFARRNSRGNLGDVAAHFGLSRDELLLKIMF